jgi:hypothetical protein
MRVNANSLPFDHALEIAAVGNEMDVEGLTGLRMTSNAFGDFDHPAGFRQIERARSEEEGSLSHHRGGD